MGDCPEMREWSKRGKGKAHTTHLQPCPWGTDRRIRRYPVTLCAVGPPLSRHGNPIQVALHALAREGVNIGSRAERNVARRNYPRPWQLQDLLFRRKPMDDTFGHQLAWGQWHEVGPAHVVYTVTQHKQLPVPGPPDQICRVNLCPKRSAAIDRENYQPFGRMRA